MSDDMYTDAPTIASDPIYVGPPETLEVDVDAVRVWRDRDGWIDEQWERDGGEIAFDDGVSGVVRVVEMIPLSEYEGDGGYDE